MSKFSGYEYRKQPGFDMNTFEGANQAIPMKTLVIHCLDPRAVEIPKAVAEYFGDEVYPGEIITDENGSRVGSTRTLFVATNAGGRAAFALESVAAMDYIFSVKNVVVVHHSFCGTTTLTPELIVEEFHDHLIIPAQGRQGFQSIVDSDSSGTWTGLWPDRGQFAE